MPADLLSGEAFCFFKKKDSLWKMLMNHNKDREEEALSYIIKQNMLVFPNRLQPISHLC